ncbi:penicillin epimerase [Brachionus plicatilis]|uniref:Penicillin epimerase n=1 Tax=Brachionus plicatilis TaxID=10195 RepID=A0A3M7PU93_BRAPC|nr:penicillin epimerase [Brachionus plicatilis]
MSNENFGSKAKLELFHLDPEITFTNHGSYGSVPKEILKEKINLQYQMESCPDKWFRLTSLDLWNKSIDSLAKYLGVESKKLVLCVNATEAINSVLKAIDLKTNDVILATEYTYPAVLNAIEYASSYKMPEKIDIIKVPIKFPINNTESFINIFDETCRLVKENNLKQSLTTYHQLQL